MMVNSIKNVNEVFGVRVDPILSYINREDVDAEFVEALNSDRQLIIYGASKQGKTALVQKHLPYHEQVVVRLSPVTTLVDIYQSVIRQCNIQIISEQSISSSKTSEISLGAKIKAVFPIFGEAGVENLNKLSSATNKVIRYEEVPYNLELAQDVCELLKRVNFDKFIILENFHYLPVERQQQFSYDLRTFQELKIRFVILGVWKEKNRLTQYNGDLDDRLKEISVEPWRLVDFDKVYKKGADLLNLSFSSLVLSKIKDSAFGSIGVFQELLKEYCIKSGISKTQLIFSELNDQSNLEATFLKKAKEYASRHERFLVAISAGGKSYAPRQGQPPLYLPYYLVKVVLNLGFEGLKDGVDKTKLQEEIRKIHYRPDDVRPGDVTNLLTTIAALQHKKNVSPPILDYNKEEKMLQVVDSTFFYYLKNIDLEDFADSIPEPFGNQDTTSDMFSDEL